MLRFSAPRSCLSIPLLVKPAEAVATEFVYISGLLGGPTQELHGQHFNASGFAHHHRATRDFATVGDVAPSIAISLVRLVDSVVQTPKVTAGLSQPAVAILSDISEGVLGFKYPGIDDNKIINSSTTLMHNLSQLRTSTSHFNNLTTTLDSCPFNTFARGSSIIFKSALSTASFLCSHAGHGARAMWKLAVFFTDDPVSFLSNPLLISYRHIFPRTSSWMKSFLHRP